MFTDQFGRKIELTSQPKRIISLVPSQTELLYDLGLRDEVVGITNYCIHPDEWFQKITHVGGTKKLDFEKIKQLNPDLIIGNKEENDKGQIEQLMKHYKVWMSDIYNLQDALNMIVQVGSLVGKQQEAVNLKLEIELQFRTISYLTSNTKNPKTAYFIWRKPYIAVGSNTFINDMLTRCGFNNLFASDASTRYPQVNECLIAEKKPEIILLSSEPYPFKEAHIKVFQSICPDSKIFIVDGEFFSWYGSRLLQAPSYFEKIIYSIQKL